MLFFCLTSANEIKADCSREAVEQCILRIARGDSAALEELYHRTSASVYSFALSILKNTHDAEDILHDLYVLVYSGAANYRACGKPMAWIITVAKNLCFQKLRERKRIADLPQEDWEPYLESNTEITPEDKIVIAECMQLLSDEERQIVVLHALSGLKHREIASLLNLPLPTVLSKYNRALKKLRKAW